MYKGDTNHLFKVHREYCQNAALLYFCSFTSALFELCRKDKNLVNNKLKKKLVEIKESLSAKKYNNKNKILASIWDPC